MEAKAGLNVTEVSTMLGLSRPVVYDLINRREHPIPCIRVGRRRIIPRQALMVWMDEETRKEAQEL